MEKGLHIGKALAQVADAALFRNPRVVPVVTRVGSEAEMVSILRNVTLAGPAPAPALPVNDVVLDAAAIASNRNR